MFTVILTPAGNEIIQKVFRASAAILTLTAFIAAPSVCRSANADETIEKGKAIYNGAGACFSCHGPTGAGDGAAAAALNPKPRNFSTGVFSFDTDKDGKTGTETDLFNVISNGAAAYGGSPLMAGRADIPEADRKALVKFVLSLKK